MVGLARDLRKTDLMYLKRDRQIAFCHRVMFTDLKGVRGHCIIGPWYR